MTTGVDPFSQGELLAAFNRRKGSVNKHLLIVYSLAIGVNAQRAIELGIGDTTRALRAAMLITGGTLFSCDIDRERFAFLSDQTDGQWQLFLEPSDAFLKRMTPPFGFILHDAAHDYWQVRQDLELMLPLMHQFGIVCIHDTQHSDIGKQMPRAIRDGCRDHKVSWVHLPFSYGLTILRLEESPHPPIAPPWGNARGAMTCCWPQPMAPSDDSMDRLPFFDLARVKWTARRLKRRLMNIASRR